MLLIAVFEDDQEDEAARVGFDLINQTSAHGARPCGCRMLTAVANINAAMNGPPEHPVRGITDRGKNPC